MAILLPNDYVSKLPSEYQELEYIESTGTQYIKTGLTNRKYYLYKFEVGFNNTAESGMVCGATPSGAYFILQEGSNCYANTGGQTQGFGKVKTNTYYDYVFDGQSNHQQCYLNGALANETTFQYDNVTTSYELYIFCRNGGSGGSAENFKRTKIYYFKIYDENRTLIYDYVPAKRKSDNVIGLYDKVSGDFFTNKGTGTFLYKEIPTMIDVENVIYNGVNLDKVIFDGVGVWENYSMPFEHVDSANFIKEKSLNYTADKPCYLLVMYGRYNTSMNFSCNGTLIDNIEYNVSGRVFGVRLYKVSAGQNIKITGSMTGGGDRGGAMILKTYQVNRNIKLKYVGHQGQGGSFTANYPNNGFPHFWWKFAYDYWEKSVVDMGEKIFDKEYGSVGGTSCHCRIYKPKNGASIKFVSDSNTGIQYPHLMNLAFTFEKV